MDIKKRAQKFSINFFRNQDKERKIAEAAYAVGAEEQRKIDVDKACEILRYMFKFRWTNHENEYFRKAMEE